MTYAITLIRSKSGARDDMFKYLLNLKDKNNLLALLKSNGEINLDDDSISIEECFISFGWPDFVLLLHGNNVELLKYAIIEIRNNAETDLETSTIVCTTDKELDRVKRKIIESV
jgi:hypothetical protein